MSIKLIKWFKANMLRLKLHVLLMPVSRYLSYIGYFLRMSKWIDENKSKFGTNDFYNSQVNHADRFKLYEFVSSKYDLKTEAISYLEFGVGKGRSLKWWSEHNNNASTIFYAYDTYTGLPEKYGSLKVGHFDMGGAFPDINDGRIRFIKGMFQDSLIPSLKDVDFNKKLVLHLDADLYTSTLYAFSILYPYLKVGDIIFFDEFGVPLEEFRAFEDITKSFYIELKPLGTINNYLQMAFEIVGIRNGSK